VTTTILAAGLVAGYHHLCRMIHNNQIQLHGEWCGRYLYNHLYTCCDTINVISIIHSLGDTTRKSNYTVLWVIKGIPLLFLRYTTIKLLKRGVIMNIPSYLQSVWWIYSGRRRYYTTINFMILYDQWSVLRTQCSNTMWCWRRGNCWVA
jgi:hypothetical protein